MRIPLLNFRGIHEHGGVWSFAFKNLSLPFSSSGAISSGWVVFIYHFYELIKLSSWCETKPLATHSYRFSDWIARGLIVWLSGTSWNGSRERLIWRTAIKPVRQPNEYSLWPKLAMIPTVRSAMLFLCQVGVDFWCYPPCEEIVHRKSFSYLKQRNNLTYLMIEYDRKGLVKRETRKMTIVDVLCESFLSVSYSDLPALIGGGTSLFLGCSCVTLMETFVFLFKLIVQGLTREVETPASEEGRSTGCRFNPVVTCPFQ